jgi:hypothetical protein
VKDRRLRPRRSSLALGLDALAIVLAVLAVKAPIPRGWIEHGYANAFFALLNRALVPVTNVVPFSVGDVELLVVLVAVVAWWVGTMRRTPRPRRARVAIRLAAHLIGYAALGIVLFELLWGLNYRRAPVAARVDYQNARVTDAAVAAFSERIVGILNANVAAAHAETLDEAKLEAAWQPVVRRLDDHWDVAVTRPKFTILQPYYDAAGIGGQYSPFSFETLLNAEFLPFEVPRALAHEWSHAGGFTDEGDANYIGTVACLRSKDPLIRYSGAFWTYYELPEKDRRRLHLDRRVIADFQASRERFLRHYQPKLFAFQWHFYDRFLRSNGVKAGVASYGFFLRLLVGTPLDADGLPVVRSKR